MPIYVMRLTGPSHRLLIASIGNGNLFVMGTEKKNQNDIIEGAHDNQIVCIVSLSKIENKYFCTKCIDGDFKVWSASTAHPDLVLSYDNIDLDETAITNNQDTQRDSIGGFEKIEPPVIEEAKSENEE